MKENLIVEVIVSGDHGDFQEKINEFSSSNVSVIATQTSFQVDHAGRLWFMAVVYYNPIKNKMLPELNGGKELIINKEGLIKC